jgi:NAD(P)H dehydrogenase (quinone)
MAKAVAEGASSVPGVEVVLRRVEETLSEEILRKMGALECQKLFSHIPICQLSELEEADAIIFGTPTRFGGMAAQMKKFIDSMGRLWVKKALIGKIGGVFTSTSTQHGGQESTILGFHTVLLHHGMIIAGLPYSFEGNGVLGEVSGCSPYGASTIVKPNNNNTPSDNELAGARFQGKYIAQLAKKLSM